MNLFWNGIGFRLLWCYFWFSLGFMLYIVGFFVFLILLFVIGLSGDNVVIIELNGKFLKEVFVVVSY